MNSVTAGPWTQPEPPSLPAADRAAAIRDALKMRKVITRLAEARELGRLAKRRLERMEPALRQAGNLIGLRTARGYIAELSEGLERVDADIEASAEHLLLALTELQGEDYAEFVARCAGDQIARATKTADLKDNLNLDRLPAVTEKDLARAEKYRAALTQLEGEPHPAPAEA